MNSAWLFLAAVLIAPQASAFQAKQPKTDLDRLEFFHPRLYAGTSNIALEDAGGLVENASAWALFFARYGNDFHIYLDPRSGSVAGLSGAIPFIPGTGVGNRMTLEAIEQLLQRPVKAVDEAVIAGLSRELIAGNAEALRVDPAHLGAIRAVQINPDLWQVNIPQEVQGVPVRRGRISLTISHGNLILAGTEYWGAVLIGTTPKITLQQAQDLAYAFIGGRADGDETWLEPRLEIVPMDVPGFDPAALTEESFGNGYAHRLTWTFGFRRPPEAARWRFTVDALSGEILAFEDQTQYQSPKRITGGVYPLTSTEICPSNDRCGAMQTGQPMPWADTGFAAPNNFTNTSGLYSYTSGTVATALAGKYLRITDTCGTVSESSSTGALDLGGVNGQHDCATAGTSAGDTPAARSAFYELNRIIELGRGWLPGNTWLRGQLPCTVNIVDTCNANYDYVGVNFFRSGGGCRNTGEIAAVFDHEWGHGLDDNDTNGSISNPGEAYADLAAILRLEASCVGYGLWWTQDKGCGQTADGTGYNQDEDQTAGLHCNLDCSGVRDSDWDKHADHVPDTPANHVCPRCSSSTYVCGRQTHCAAAPVRQAAWDLAARDLRGAPFNMTQESAFLLANRLFYQGSGNVGDWYTCACPSTSGGCGANNGYMQWLAADDDNGNLNDGTPHMTALYAAYNRHAIACATPAPVNSGCAPGPVAAAVLSGIGGNNMVSLSWNAVPGAARYWVFRGDGYAGCDFGKALIAEVTGTTYNDPDTANGQTYYYSVTAVGATAACMGPASNCVAVTPQPCAGVVALDRPLYSCSDLVEVTVLDSTVSAPVTVTFWSSVDGTPKSLTLVNDPPGSASYTGAFTTTSGAAGPNQVRVAHGAVITVRYTDPDYCGTPNHDMEAAAAADCVAPVISNVLVTGITDGTATVTWTTNEAANSRVTYGPGTPPGTNADDLTAYVTGHSLTLTGLTGCTPYYFSVTSADPAGNTATDTNGGTYYGFTTYGRMSAMGPDDVEGGAKNWVASGTPNGWHISTCRANSATHAWKAGNADCATDYAATSDNYLAWNANITLGAAGHGYHLRFMSWYDTEQNSGCTYDPIRPQISTNGGTNWTTLATDCGTSGGWVQKDYDLAAFTGSQVRIRFWFQSDGGVFGEGWYVDDIGVSRAAGCSADVLYAGHTFTEACNGTGSGGGNGILEPGEEAVIAVSAVNSGMQNATSVTGTLSTPTPGVTITDGSAAFPNMTANGGTGTSQAPHFAIHVDPAAPCVTTIAFILHTASTENPSGSDSGFTMAVGQAGGAAALYGENFDGVTAPALPPGWAVADTSGTSGNWATNAGTRYPIGGGANTSPNVAYFNSYSATSGNATRLYRTGGFAIPGSLGSCTLGFHMYHDNGYSANNDTIQPQISTNGGGSWTNLGAPIARYSATNEWTQHTVSMDAYIGQADVRIAFLRTSAYGNDCHIDTVAVTYPTSPTCNVCVSSGPIVQVDGSFNPNASLVQICGDGDSTVEPGEDWRVTVRLKNTGTGDATNTAASLAVNAGSAVAATIQSGNPGAFGTIASGGGTATADFVFRVDAGAACGNDITFDVTGISSAEKSYPSQSPAFTVPVGLISAGGSETKTQQTTPLNATNNTVNSNLGAVGFTLEAADTATLGYSNSYTAGPGPTVTLFGPDDFATAAAWTSTGGSLQTETKCVASTPMPSASYYRINQNQSLTLTNAVSTVGYTDIRVAFHGAVQAAGATLYLDWSPDGSTWNNNVWSTASTTWNCDRTVTLPGGAAGQAGFRIRFRDTGGGTTQRGKVDYVRVLGTGPAAGSWTANARVSLVNPSAGATVLKAYGAADGNPYNVQPYYTGPGMYQLRLEENAGGTATITNGSMQVVMNPTSECDVAGCGTSAAPPPVNPTGAGAAKFTKGAGNTLDVTYDAVTCSAEKLIILYGNIGTWTGYAGCAQSDGGNGGSTTVNSAGQTSTWYNLVWTQGTTAGHPGFAFNGSTNVARNWAVGAGVCGITANDQTKNTCP